MSLRTYPDSITVLSRLVESNWSLKDLQPNYGFGWFDGSNTPQIIFRFAGEPIKFNRAFHYNFIQHMNTQKVYVWTRSLEERGRVMKELDRIFERYRTNPPPNYKTFHVTGWQPLENPDPLQKTWSAWCVVEMQYALDNTTRETAL